MQNTSTETKQTNSNGFASLIEKKGWLQGIRGNNHVQFLQLRTEGEVLQVVIEKAKLGEEQFKAYKALPQETSIRVTGHWQENPKAPSGREILLENLEVIGVSDNYPITPKEHGPDFHPQQPPSLASFEETTRHFENTV